MNRDFSQWLKTFRQSINGYTYYIDFAKVYGNVEKLKVEINILKAPPHNCAQTIHIIPADPKFREKAQFKRIVCTRNKPRYATFIRLRARYKFASANSVQQC